MYMDLIQTIGNIKYSVVITKGFEARLTICRLFQIFAALK